MGEIDGREYILNWLDKHGVCNKDSKKQKNKSSNSRITFGKKKKVHRKIVDLHGKIKEEAVLILKNALFSCKEQGIKEILIIHGKGLHSSVNDGPVIKSTVHFLLRNDFSNYVKSFSDAPRHEGGEGATVVRLK